MYSAKKNSTTTLSERSSLDSLNSDDSTTKTAQSTSTMALRGYLKKKGGMFGNYSKHWIVVERNVLYVFPSHQDSSPSLVVPLDGASVVGSDELTGKVHSFCVFPKDSQALYFYCDSDSVRDQWVRTISKHQGGTTSTQSGVSSILDTVEAMLDSAVVADERGTIVAFNSQAEKMFGWTKAEIIGQNVKLLMPDAYSTQHDQLMANYFRTGHKKLIGKARKLVAKRKNGFVFPMEISLGEMPANEHNAKFMAVFRELAPNTHKDGAGDKQDRLGSFGAGGCPFSSGGDEDTESGFEYTKLKILGKIADYSQALQKGVEEELLTLRGRFAQLEAKYEIATNENAKLIAELSEEKKKVEKLEAQLHSSGSSSMSVSLPLSELQLLLHDRIGLAAFRDFCRSEKSSENIDFWVEAERFKEIIFQADLKMKATEIFAKFIDSLGSESLNLDADARDDIKSKLGNPNRLVFTNVQQSVLQQMSDDTFPRFCETGTGKVVLDSVRKRMVASSPQSPCPAASV